jgi:DNA polymerase III subunit gamma/tau
MLEGRSVDIIEIDGASNNSVDDVRKLRDNAKYAPMSGRYKMYIIDEVHMLSTAAFNALLKTLEEPPAHLIFVFATTEIHKVPATILSRCQRFDFRRMEIDTITSHLRHIAAAEKITIDDASLVAIAKKADGSMRDSQSIFDQVVSFCGTSITIGDVSAALHLIDVDFFFALSTAIRSHDIPAMFALARQVIDRGYDLQECLIGLLEHFRNILTVITTQGTDLIEASAEHLARYRDEAAQFTKEDALRIMTLLSQGEAVLRQNPPQPRVRFEFTLVQVASMDSSVDLGKVLAGLSGAPSQQRPASAPPAIPSTSSQRIVGGVAAIPQPIRVGSPVIVRAQKNPVSSLTAGNLARRWSDVLESLPEHLVFVKASAKQQMLTVDFTDIGIVLRPHAEIVHHRLIDKIAALKTHLAEMYNTPVGVQLIEPRTAERAAAQASSDATPTTEPVLASAQSEDLLPIEQTLIDLFKARRASAPGK